MALRFDIFRDIIIPFYTRILYVSFYIVNYCLFKYISDSHPTRFGDESHHLNIGLKYCQGKYDYWSDEVTQYHGMYWISVYILRCMEFVFQTDTCKVHFLRAINYIIAVCTTPIFGLIIIKITQMKACLNFQGIHKFWIYAINHGMFPVLYFFSFFYYPEPLSVLSVLLTYYLYLKGRHITVVCAGILACMVNDSNVVWVGFINMLQFFSAVMYDTRKFEYHSVVIDSESHVPVLRMLLTHTVYLFATCDKVVKKHFICSKYSFVCLFSFFTMMVNKGTLFHSWVINIPQLLYFCLFYIIFSPCSAVLSIPDFLNCILSAKKATMWVVVSLAVIIYFNADASHILADNRYYEYYVWKVLLEGNLLFQFFLIPFYMLGGYAIICKLKDERTHFILAYIPAIFLHLVTQNMFELRYYILPFVILTLHSSERHIAEVFIESFYFISINVFIFMFFYRQ